MVSVPFRGPFARIDSASAHLSHLITLQTEFFDSDAFEWATERRPDGIWINKIVQKRDLPEKFEHVAWDAIQNLRSSLDLAVCATAISEDVPDLKNTYFHFASSQEQWEASFKGRTRAAPSYAIDVMRKFKPWPEGNATLYALSKVSAVTRHQLIVPSVLGNSSIVVSNNVVWNGPGPTRIGAHSWNPITREIIITETGFQISVPVDGYQFTTFLAFGDVAPVAGKPIIPMLNALIEICKEIVHA